MSNISLPSFLYAIGFIGLFVLGIVGMAEISWTLVRSVLKLRPDPEFADRPLNPAIPHDKRASTARSRIGQCDLSGIEEVVFLATGWQQDTSQLGCG